MKLIKQENSIVLEHSKYSTFFGGLVLIAISTFFIFNSFTSTFSNIASQLSSIILFIVGLWLFLTSKKIKIKIDGSSRKLFYETKSIIGSGSKEYLFNYITNVRLDKFIKRGRHASKFYHFVLNFILYDKSYIPFEFGEVSTRCDLSVQNKIYDDAKFVADFIGVSFEKKENLDLT